MDEQKMTPKHSEVGVEYVRDMTDEEIDRLIALRRSKDIHIIRNWIIFFGVIAVIGLAAGVISMFIH